VNDCNQDLSQTDEEILKDEVSDEAIEALPSRREGVSNSCVWDLLLHLSVVPKPSAPVTRLPLPSRSIFHCAIRNSAF
jgi:hypothetical protein